MAGLFPFQGSKTETDVMNEHVASAAQNIISNTKILENEIAKFKSSEKRKWMLTGEDYYEGEHAILKHERTFIGRNGALEVAKNLPNNRILDNQYAKLVDQKVNYQLGKPITLKGENTGYVSALELIFNRNFHRTLKAIGQDAMNTGLGWLYPYYDELGNFAIKRIVPYELIPFWKDSEKTIIEYAIRIYPVVVYEGEFEKVIEKVEVYSADGIETFEWFNGKLVPDVMTEPRTYITVEKDEQQLGFNWERVPLIPFKFNSKMIPLIKRVKSLQDAINTVLSDFQNNMQEDARNTILVIENYDGQDLGELRKNLAQFGAIKVRSIDGQRGGVDTLTVEVNSDNYKTVHTLLKKALIENGRGYDSKDERMGGNPNQMNIQSMYADIELDANGIETEFQASFEQLLWFINRHLENTTGVNYDSEKVEIIFNRDVLINEAEVIENLSKSEYLSEETKIEMHPYITDVEAEIKRKKKEQQEQMDLHDNYSETFEKIGGGGGGSDGKVS